MNEIIQKLRRRVFNLFNQKSSPRNPSKMSSFSVLKKMNIPINTVIDIGVLESTEELISAYPDMHHLLCEPVAEFEETIKETYGKRVKSYDLVMEAIADQVGTAFLNTSSVDAKKGITHAKMFFDDSLINETTRRIPVNTIDNIVAARTLEKPYLLKIDIDGNEIAVIKGATDTLADCSVVCIEAGIKDIHQRLSAIRAHGFQLFDIVDICYYENRLIQMDLIFVKTSILKNLGLEIYSNGFDISNWKPYL